MFSSVVQGKCFYFGLLLLGMQGMQTEYPEYIVAGNATALGGRQEPLDSRFTPPLPV